MGAVDRNHVTVSGNPHGPVMMFAHGFGCDQNMWRLLTPRFADRYQIVLFDYVGAGRSELSAYDPARYSTLAGYADDVLDILAELDLHGATFVGHSVSAMIGALASITDPERFSRLILVAPSPRYIDDPPYVGGFSEQDVTELLDSLDSNYLGWSAAIAPVVMGSPDRPELAQELTSSFCRTDPDIAARFARVTFLSDNRADLPHVGTPSLVLQCTNDALAPVSVGQYVAQAIPDCELVLLDATGHCPHLSAPDQTADAIEQFLAGAVGSRNTA